MEPRKGLQCKNCLNCKTRVFVDLPKYEEWLAHKDTQLNNRRRTEGPVTAYWCSLEEPIMPVVVPPWWRNKDTVKHGCIFKQ